MLVLVLLATPAFAATKAIRAGTLIDPAGTVITNIVAVDGDPLADVTVLINTVRWVMKGGTVVVDQTGSGGSGRAGGAVVAGDHKAVKDLVEAFLLHLGDHEIDKVAADLAPKAIVIVARLRDGQWSNSVQTGDEWLAAMTQNPNASAFREPMTNVTVSIDSDHLACLRADFQVMRDGKAQSYGVDQFTLVRDPSGWKIAVVAYTSMPVK